MKTVISCPSGVCLKPRLLPLSKWSVQLTDYIRHKSHIERWGNWLVSVFQDTSWSNIQVKRIQRDLHFFNVWLKSLVNIPSLYEIIKMKTIFKKWKEWENTLFHSVSKDMNVPKKEIGICFFETLDYNNSDYNFLIINNL